MKVDRTCPRCRAWLYHPVLGNDIPPALGASTPAAVLIQCNAPTCGHRWRGRLSSDEREEFEQERAAAAALNMPRSEGFYWMRCSDGWEPAYYCAKGWELFRSASTAYFPDEHINVADVGPMLPFPHPPEVKHDCHEENEAH